MNDFGMWTVGSVCGTVLNISGTLNDFFLIIIYFLTTLQSKSYIKYNSKLIENAFDKKFEGTVSRKK